MGKFFWDQIKSPVYEGEAKAVYVYHLFGHFNWNPALIVLPL